MSGVDWTFSPMIDVARDPRWGRVAEGYCEDPYTNGVFGAASVKGYQGDDLSAENRMAACLKIIGIPRRDFSIAFFCILLRSAGFVSK